MITLTDNAISHLTKLTSQNSALFLRISVSGGGCSGFQYHFSLDDNINDIEDQIFKSHNQKVVVDSISLPFLLNSIIDFIEDLAGSKFVVSNPNAASGCGCGSSFSL